MRTLVLLLGVAALAVATNLYDDSQGYQSNTEYVYRYQSRAVTGIPHRASENTGLVLRCNVRLQFRDQTTVIAKCEDTEVYKVIGQWRFQEDLPEDFLQQVDSSELTTIRSEVEKPFAFRWLNGKITELRVANDEPSWSVNIKKGIMNMLKINLTPETHPRDPQLQDLMQKLKSAQYGQQINLQDPHYANFYKVMEDGISGRCESIYGITGSPDWQPGMTVTKVRNYKKCDTRSNWEEGIFTSLTTTGQGFDTRNIIEKYSHADFSIKGIRRSFIIQSVRVQSKYIVRPFTEYHGDIVTRIFQDLELISVQPISTPLPPGTRVVSKPLLFEIPNYHLEKNMVLTGTYGFGSGSLYASFQQDKVSKVDGLISRIIDNMNQETIPDETFDMVNAVQRLMKYMSEDELWSLLSQYLNADTSSDLHKKKQFTLDLLAAVPTSDSLMVHIKLLVDPRVPAESTTMRLRQLAFKVIPDAKVMTFVKPGGEPTIPNLLSNTTLRDPVLLSIGVMIHRIYHHVNNSGVPLSTFDSYFTDLAEKFTQVYQNSPNQPTREMLLKAIGNSGIPHFMPLLKKIVVDNAQPKELRALAMFASRRIPQIYNDLITEYVLPVYLDATEETDVRIASFLHIMDRSPCNRTIQLLMHAHNNDTNLNVGALVFNYLETISTAKFPALKPLATTVRKLLPMVRPVRTDTWQYPTAFHLESVMTYLDQAIGLDFIRVNSPESSQPSYLVNKLSVFNMGKSINAIELGLYGEGLKTWLSKLVGPLSTMLDDIKTKSFDEMTDFLFNPVLKRQPGDYEVDIHKLIEKLDIKEREVFDKLKLRYYLKVLDVEVSAMDLDQNTILRYLKDNIPVNTYGYYGNGGNILKTLRTLNLGRSSQVIPTTMGISMYVNHTMWTMVHLDGSYSASPSTWLDWFKACLGYEKISAKIETTNTKFSMATFVERKAGVNMIPISCGVSQRFTSTSSVPLTARVTIDSTDKVKVSLHVETPSQLINILHVKYSSKVFVKSMELPSLTIVSITNDVLPLTMTENNIPVTTVATVPLPSISSSLMCSWTIPNTKPTWVSAPNVWHKFDFKMQLNKDQSTPIVLDMIFVKGRPDTKQNVPQGYRTWISRSQQYEDVSDVKVYSEMDDNPVMYKVIMKIGSPSQPLTIVPYFATCTSQWKFQTGIKVTTPSSTKYVIEGMWNAWNTIKPQYQRSDSDVLFLMDVILNQVELHLKASSSNDEVTFDHATQNIFYDYLTNQFGIDIQSAYKTQRMDLPADKMNYNIQLDYQLPADNDNVTRFVDFWTNYTTHLLYPSYKKDPADSNAPPEGRIISKITYVPKWDKALINVLTPWSLYSIETPWFLPTYQVPYWYKLSYMKPVNSSEFYTQDLYHQQKFKKYHYVDATHGMCTIKKKDDSHLTVKTFDNHQMVSKEIPPNCPIVLSKDCTNTNMWTLTGMFTTERNIQLTLVVPQHTIKLIPSTSQWNLRFSDSTGITVQVDSMDMTPTDGETKNIMDGEGIIGTITRNGMEFIITMNTGVALRYDVTNKLIHFMVSPTAGNGYPCGLCGNYNGRLGDDLEGPSGRIYRLDDEHVYNYMIPLNSCPKEDLRRRWGIVDPRDECEPEERTYVTESRIEGQSALCLSTSPIKLCPVNSRVTRFAGTKNVGMYCVPANNVNAYQLAQAARQRQVLTELIDKPVHKYEQVSEHAQCQKDN